MPHTYRQKNVHQTTQQYAFFLFFPIRIERLWRDVYVGALDLFYTIFNKLETEGLLNPDNEVHLYALHQCHVPHIQKHLEVFQHGWNCHRLSSEGNQSPLQLWTYQQRDAQQEPLE
ncbi:hypothetical protein AMECASPLE_039090, partial [Ameca splendens]